MWSWSNSVYWPSDSDGSMHYDGTFRYVAAVYDVIRWEGSTELLDKVDGSTVGTDTAKDASKGMTVYDKCCLAIDYMLYQLHGNEGTIHITEDSMLLSDGVTRFDVNGKGNLTWNNTGRLNSSASNYWDNLCFGNLDAYESELFYHALDCMAGIETMRGNTEKADEYRQLMVKVHAKYDELFWSEETGRYIGCIDVDGVVRDFGFTFLNLEALAYGLGDVQKAESIFSWIDGERIVEGDTSTGSDIMSYTNLINPVLKKSDRLDYELCIAPRANTLKIESVRENKSEYWWSDCDGGILVTSNARFGKHLENGGYIFYTVFYELLARTRYVGADSTMKRFEQISHVYSYNGLNSDLGTWIEGLVGEYPESGLAGVPYLYSLLGINPGTDGLVIAPQVPSSCEVIGSHNVNYKGCSFTAEADIYGSVALYSNDTGFEAMHIDFKPMIGNVFDVLIDDGSDTPCVMTGLRTDENGFISIDTDMDNVNTIIFDRIG